MAGIVNEKPKNFAEGTGLKRNLVCAVIIQAILDWQEDIKGLKEQVSPNHIRCRSKKWHKVSRIINDEIAEIVEFLSSGICEALGIDHRWIIDNIESIEIPEVYATAPELLFDDYVSGCYA